MFDILATSLQLQLGLVCLVCLVASTGCCALLYSYFNTVPAIKKNLLTMSVSGPRLLLLLFLLLLLLLLLIPYFSYLLLLHLVVATSQFKY